MISCFGTLRHAQGNRGVELWSETGKAFWMPEEVMCLVLSFLGDYRHMQAARYGEKVVEKEPCLTTQAALAHLLASV
jgi:hypothetical protein